MQCEIEGCKRESKTNRYGNLCLMHYKRFHRHRDIHANKNEEAKIRGRKREASKCKYCDRNVGRNGALGMCNKHYQMHRKHGDAMCFDRRVRSKSHGYYRVGKKGQHEHRKIYEDYIGRKLLKDEVVHHIDFNRTNNNIENLYLYNNKSEHTRQHCNHRRLLKQLQDNEIIKFKDGVYYKEHI
jgi:hypothetical protein